MKNSTKRSFWFLMFLTCTALPLSAQFGVTAFYNFNNIRANSSEVRDNYSYPIEDGVELQAHYWFRLPKKRIEFQPTVFYAGTTIGLEGFFSDQFYNIRDYGFQFEVNIYPL
ncbi:hypothetical protein [Neolewinella antarctica]|uniref:Uncharacterized protein n=1 Tax=Neolewinella antarctica TaxID=442734 RepID=A0ABX0X6T4_9BACT|nr:hypothetical protein [Neolewinella antarctica]NJC24770.1 hypothetical protein [Neolewinella antarctica]